MVGISDLDNLIILGYPEKLPVKGDELAVLAVRSGHKWYPRRRDGTGENSSVTGVSRLRG